MKNQIRETMLQLAKEMETCGLFQNPPRDAEGLKAAANEAAYTAEGLYRAACAAHMESSGDLELVPFMKSLKDTATCQEPTAAHVVKCFQNCRDMAEGCVNRICVCDTHEERLAMYKSLLGKVKAMYDYRRHINGDITLETVSHKSIPLG